MKADYALRALFTLVDRVGGAPVSIRELAVQNNIPKKFLEQIMLSMKERGWVRSSAGLKGGYLLGRDPERITIIDALPGTSCPAVAAMKRADFVLMVTEPTP